jgi:hypothetical protein
MKSRVSFSLGKELNDASPDLSPRKSISSRSPGRRMSRRATLYFPKTIKECYNDIRSAFERKILEDIDFK